MNAHFLEIYLASVESQYFLKVLFSAKVVKPMASSMIFNKEHTFLLELHFLVHVFHTNHVQSTNIY